jgi:hypothetical protein
VQHAAVGKAGGATDPAFALENSDFHPVSAGKPGRRETQQAATNNDYTHAQLPFEAMPYGNHCGRAG